jgi:hypothetical protein
VIRAQAAIPLVEGAAVLASASPCAWLAAVASTTTSGADGGVLAGAQAAKPSTRIKNAINFLIICNSFSVSSWIITWLQSWFSKRFDIASKHQTEQGSAK